MRADAAERSTAVQCPVRLAVTVGVDGIVRQIVVAWGTTASFWRYAITYSGLGATPDPTAPTNARTLRELRARPTG